MTEIDAIRISTDGPITLAVLIEDLERIGIEAGMTLLVHSSLSAMGWVCGGAVAVVRALETVLGSTGTLVMPTHSGDLSDPAGWNNPPVERSWWQPIRDTMPPFDADLTPTRGMGVVPECFRKQDGVMRSCHPQVSFAAWGANAEYVVSHHALAYGLGEESPLARIYALGASVLSIGVDHDASTSLHLAEYRSKYPAKAVEKCGAPMMVNGTRHWVTFDDLNLDSDDFKEIGRVSIAR